MKALTTLEIIIIIVILIVTALFVLSWLGIGSSPLDWMKRENIKSIFCSEIIDRTKCLVIEVSSPYDLGISEDDLSSKIRNRDIGVKDGDEFASYKNICNYLGVRSFKECLVKLCGCKIK
ncbi:MAG: hypothetical protein QXW35_01970 [Candidatus Aenigmatarchaeota archaeon]